MDRVKRLWKRVENVVKTSNCATKNSRTNSIKGGECRNPLKKKKKWSSIFVVVESRAIWIDREVLKYEVGEEVIVS